MQCWEFCCIFPKVETKWSGGDIHWIEVRLITKEGYKQILKSETKKWSGPVRYDEGQMVNILATLGLDGWQPCIDNFHFYAILGMFMRACSAS